MSEENKVNGLELLRVPFTPNQINKLPKPTPAQTKEVKDDYRKGIRCDLCGGWHHPKAIHFDYVGHAALTDRLLDADPEWNWEPMSVNEKGQPVYDSIAGMWIKLTVCGVSRLGYGSAEGKKGGNAIKEVIGDALRNAAMRFGAGLDLWHKGELHQDSEEQEQATTKKVTKASLTDIETKAIDQLFSLSESKDVAGINQIWTELNKKEQSNVWAKLPYDTQTNLNNLWKGV